MSDEPQLKVAALNDMSSDAGYSYHTRDPDPIGELLFSRDTADHPGTEDCQVSVHFAWDQWARCRLICDHGTFEAVAGAVHFTEALSNALQCFHSFPHPYRCYEQTPVPQEWIDGDSSHKEGDTEGCDLWRGHEGDHKIYATWAEEDARPMIYAINGKVVDRERPTS